MSTQRMQLYSLNTGRSDQNLLTPEHNTKEKAAGAPERDNQCSRKQVFLLPPVLFAIVTLAHVSQSGRLVGAFGRLCYMCALGLPLSQK